MIWRVVFRSFIRQLSSKMNDNELDDLIRQTHPKPEFPASFQREVWARVSVAEQTSRAARYRRWSESLFQLIAQPATAVTVVTMMLLLGAGLGRLASPETDSEALHTAYVVSINPVAAAHLSNRE
jgi:hypothetical protein